MFAELLGCGLGLLAYYFARDRLFHTQHKNFSNVRKSRSERTKSFGDVLTLPKSERIVEPLVPKLEVPLPKPETTLADRRERREKRRLQKFGFPLLLTPSKQSEVVVEFPAKDSEEIPAKKKEDSSLKDDEKKTKTALHLPPKVLEPNVNTALLLESVREGEQNAWASGASRSPRSWDLSLASAISPLPSIDPPSKLETLPPPPRDLEKAANVPVAAGSLPLPPPSSGPPVPENPPATPSPAVGVTPASESTGSTMSTGTNSTAAASMGDETAVKAAQSKKKEKEKKKEGKNKKKYMKKMGTVPPPAVETPAAVGSEPPGATPTSVPSGPVLSGPAPPPVPAAPVPTDPLPPGPVPPATQLPAPLENAAADNKPEDVQVAALHSATQPLKKSGKKKKTKKSGDRTTGNTPRHKKTKTKSKKMKNSAQNGSG